MKLSELRRLTLIERVEMYSLKVGSGCIEWIGTIENNGYGSLKYKGKRLKAHRASWEVYNGEIPKDMLVLHKCDNPRCVNPEHLFLGTQKDNMDDMKQKGRERKIGVKGEDNHNTSLTTEDVVSIRRRFIGGEERNKLQAEYSLGKTSLQSILSNKTWKHAPLGSESSELCKKGFARAISNDDVKFILEWHKWKKISRKDMADKYGVSLGMIDLIVAGKVYKRRQND